MSRKLRPDGSLPEPEFGRLPAAAGVFAVQAHSPFLPGWRTLDVGDSQNIRLRILHHDRKPQWERQRGPLGMLRVVFTLMPSPIDRKAVVGRLIAKVRPACEPDLPPSLTLFDRLRSVFGRQGRSQGDAGRRQAG